MEYYTITSLGKQVILQLQETNRDDEADILDFLRVNGASTAQRIYEGLPLLNESEVRFKLGILVREKWVRRRRTKTVM